MYKTKKDVDAHVRSALSKLRSETERQLRSFTIAKLYYKINEYPSAEQYLCSYLSVKEDNDQAHKLLGQCYQRLKKPEKALQSFQQSLQLNPKQPEVLAEVCQLLLEDKNLSVNKAKYWCELAESEKVQHDAVFSLRLKLMNKENLETNQVEDLIQKEISARPNDVQLRVRLMRNYIEQNKILDAFKYVYNLEMSMNDNFVCNSEWYNIVWLVLNKYEQMPNTKKDWEFWLLLIMCLERQVYISFSMSTGHSLGGVTETANLLFNLDQYMFKITQLSDKLCAQRELVNLFLEHYRGQILLHAASVIFKRELLQNKNKWKETVKAVLPLLLLAYQIAVPNNKEPWMKHSDEQGKQLIQLWSREGSFRCAQAGRTLLSCIIDENLEKENGTLQINNMLGNNPQLWNNSDELLAQIRQTCSDKQWRRNVFALLFCNSDQKVKEQSSLLIKSPKIAEPIFELPIYAEVELYEETAQYLKPQSLQHMVYLCLGNDNLAYVRAKYFSGLNFSTQNLPFCGVESLNQLDVETFLYAASIQAKRSLAVEREAFDNYNSGNRSAAGRPRILPFVNLQGQLCTEEQGNWWLAAYQVYKNLSNDNLAELRANLQFGIEAVRGVNGPKIDMIIVFKLGQIFVARAQDIVKPVEKAFLEARAENIYKYGLNMVKMNNKGVLEPFRKYFKYAKSNTSVVEREVANAAEDAVSYLATRYFKKAEYEDLIEELTGIQLPFATYLQAEAYRKLDEANKTPKKAKRMYLDLAADCLNQTQQLLKNTATDPNHPLNSIIHTEMKRLQQATIKYMRDGSPITGHNNSSTYEDAETDYYPDISASGLNRSRREAAAAALIASPRNTEMENLVKQIANTLSFVKEELIETIKPEMLSMRKEISSLKEKVSSLEEAMKRTRISSNPPSRDDASNVLDDLYMIEDALQNHIYQPTSQSHMPVPGSMFSNVSNGPNAPGGVHAPFVPPQPQQQQTQQRNSMQLQQNAMAAAAAYNSPIFNPNYPMNYYTQQYMMSQPGAPGAPTAGLLGQRTLPYIDTGMNFNMAPSTPLLPVPNQEARSSNLYGLLAQQPQPSVAPQLPQLSVPMSIPQLVAPITSIAPVNVPIPTIGTLAAPVSQPVPPPVQFNKALNNQPVEKGPPANVVITSSDPLPNPNSASLLAQQPTLSVTIPPQHIKPSLVPATETSVQPPTVVSQTPTTNGIGGGSSSSFVGFGSTSTSTPSPFAGFGSNLPIQASSTTSIFSGISGKSICSTAATTSISTTTFSFKPQIEQAQALAAASAAEEAIDNSLNKTVDSISSELNKSGNEPETEYDPRPDFKPIIPLPDEIEVKTGEEDEEVMFCCRAKLFRLVDKDWKERGIGDIKILKNKEGYSRILMRRDQTHKICANHKVTKELILNTPNNEKKGHIWVANDFADEELKFERFFVRFKLPESAQQFFDAFKKAQKEAEALDVKKEKQPSAQIKPSKIAEEKTQKPAVVPPFGLSKSTVANFTTSTPASKASSDNSLVASTTPSSITNAASAAPNNTVSKTLFSGFNPSTIANTNLSVPTNKTDPPKPTASPFANFSFEKASSIMTSTQGSAATATSTASPFANIFGSLNKATSSPFSTVNLPSFQSSVITTTTATTSSVVVSSNSAPTSSLNKSNVSDADDDYTPTATFNPVIPLPDLVEVSTGEENETVLFEHRAKLLRFDKDAGEWKERGIGNIKLLQEKDDVNKVRLIMRREQVHKLCCNQRLYKNTAFKYAKNSQSALCWAGQDFSENELITEMLTVRFKTAETCKQFYDVVLKAQAAMSADAEEDKVKAKEIADKENVNEKELAKTEKETSKGFGDAFKPKAGSWSCAACYVSNASDKLYCLACDSPKDDTVPKKEATNLLSQPNKTNFSFGFTPAATATVPAISTNFTFGIPSTATSSVTTTTATTTPSTVTAVAKPAGSGFGDKFKPKAGSWCCQSCYVNNDAETIYCKACDAPKDDTVPKKDTTNNVLALSNPTQKFSFGFNVAGNDSKPASTTGFVFGAPTTTQSDPAKSLFGNLTTVANSFTFTPTTVAAAATSASLSKPSFSFNLQSKAMEFSSMPSTAVGGAGGAGGAGEAGLPFSLDKKDFNFTLKPKSPGKSGKSPMKFGGGGGDADVAADEGDDGVLDEEEENNTYFTPVIPLPDKVDVKTGEEEEELLYVHRAKLYRFVDGEWKERGLGDVKILRHKETKKLRVVMRRDQVLKICLNHVLNEDIEYKVKDDKSWLFVVNDYSEGTVELEKFSLRFKSKEIAQEFMKAVKSALEGTAAPVENISGNNVSANTSLNESLMEKTEKSTATATATATATSTTSTTLSNSEKEIADKLHLPYEFFTAQPTCSGCRGCDPDSFDFSSLHADKSFADEVDDNNPLVPMEMPVLTLPIKSPFVAGSATRSLLKQSALTSVAPAASPVAISAVNVPSKEGETNIFSGFRAKPVEFGSVNASEKNASAFSFTAALNSSTKADENKMGSGGFVFGGSNTASNVSGGSLFGGTGDKKPVFGEKSIFGNINATTKASESGTATDKPSTIFGGSVFGAKPVFGSGSTSLFDNKSTINNEPTKSIFGSSASNQPLGTSGNSIFGSSFASFGNASSAQSSLFGGNNANAPKVNTNSSGPAFSEFANNEKLATPTFADLSSKAGVVDFASLAAKANSTTQTKPVEKPSPGGFIGLTDQDSFSNFSKSTNKNASTLKDNANDSIKSAEDDENYDPHYEPIIELPKEIVVSTGEEEETKLFGERAQLYRFDPNTKEWKERGVGELKILFHPVKQTYRLIMRREQIHKLVLNHAVGADFVFSIMNKNPKSYVWATMNYAEATEGELENLAVRFKNVELAGKFSNKLNECIEAAKQR